MKLAGFKIKLATIMKTKSAMVITFMASFISSLLFVCDINTAVMDNNTELSEPFALVTV
jgi:hypothetical protein